MYREPLGVGFLLQRIKGSSIEAVIWQLKISIRHHTVKMQKISTPLHDTTWVYSADVNSKVQVSTYTCRTPKNMWKYFV